MKKIFVILLTAASITLGCKPKSAREDSVDRSDTSAKADISAVKPPVDTSKAIAPDKLIVPGKSIGKITIGASADSASAILGKPDSSDAAMGSALMVWYAGHKKDADRISIFARHNYGGKDENVAHIRKVLITSPGYKTAEGIGVGQDLDAYKKYFTLISTGTYKSQGKKIKVYEAKDKGIAFGIDSATNKCVLVVVHEPKDTGTAYINMY